MKTKYLSTKLLPYIIAIIIFLFLCSIYFSPQILGYSLSAADTNHYLGVSKEIQDFRAKENEDPIWTNSIFGGMPSYQITVKHNTNFITYIENTLILNILKKPIGIFFIAMLGFFILLLCINVDPWISIIGSIAFGFATINILYLSAGHSTRVHAIALMPLVVGGILYTYRRHMIIGGVLSSLFLCLHVSANHIQQTYYLLFLILAIFITEFIRHIKENQVKKFIYTSLVLIFAAILGILPTASNLLTTYEYGKFTMRGKSEITVSKGQNQEEKTTGLDPEYIKRYSFGYGEEWSLVIPNAKGEWGNLGNEKELIKKVDSNLQQFVGSFPKYWGEQYYSGGAIYFSVVIFLLFILGMVFLKDVLKWALLGVSILSIILSWKYSSIVDFFIYNFPLFNKFRDTKIILVLVQISFPLLAMIFINYFLSAKIKFKRLLNSILIIFGVFLFIFLIPDVFFSFFSKNELSYFEQQFAHYKNDPNAIQYLKQAQNSIKNIRLDIFKRDAGRSILFIILSSVLLLAYAKSKLKKPSFLIGIGLLILIDLWMINKRCFNNEKRGREYIRWVKKDQQFNPYRANIADKAILNYEIEENRNLGQQINNEIDRYFNENSVLNKNKEVEREKIAFRELNFASNYRVLTLQNPFINSQVPYFHKSIGGYHGAKLRNYQDIIEFRISVEMQKLIQALKNNLVYEQLSAILKNDIPTLNMLNTKYIIYNSNEKPIINPFINGNAWLIRTVNFVENADEEILSLDSINPKETAVIQSKYDVIDNFKYDSLAKIELEVYKPNYLKYNYNSISPQIAVFSEIFYPKGWNAYVDGKLATHFRANYILRAMNLPDGKHTIEFKFEPKTFYIGKKISMVSSIILIFACLITLVGQLKNKKII